MYTRRSPLGGLLALIAVLMLGFVGVSYAMGWLEFHDESDRTTIQFNKTEAKSDTDRAVERTEEFFEDTGDAIKDAGRSFHNDNHDSHDDVDD